MNLEFTLTFISKFSHVHVKVRQWWTVKWKSSASKTEGEKCGGGSQFSHILWLIKEKISSEENKIERKIKKEQWVRWSSYQQDKCKILEHLENFYCKLWNH